jgi:hypothetical protein
MGLGLAIVERACALLDHPLSLQSRVGHGTRFGVTLPLAHTTGAMATPLAPTDSNPGSGDGSLIVLLVENDAELRRALCLLLEKWNLSVIDVASAEEALALLDDLGIVPDRFLVDLQLGSGMDGAALIRALRARYGDIAASLITARRLDEVRAEAPDIAVLGKPVDFLALSQFLLG